MISGKKFLISIERLNCWGKYFEICSLSLSLSFVRWGHDELVPSTVHGLRMYVGWLQKRIL